MKFEKHLFISYAHLDNQPLSEQQQGWITRFHWTLSTILSMRLGRPAVIWRDSKVDRNDIFADEIVEQLANVAILISVVTPRYVESEWCRKEVRAFCQKASETGGLVIDNKSRAIKVIKTPGYDESALPADMQKQLGYPFFVLKDETPVELDPLYGEDLTPKYNVAIAALAWNISKLIRTLDLLGTGEHAPPPPKRMVYLAECSSDMREAREAIDSDLRLHGFTVLPDHELPRDEVEYVAEVDALLAKCELSIHVVGGRYGAVPDGPSNKSVVVLQNERAIERRRVSRLPRIIWIPDGVPPKSPQQQAFLASLATDATAQSGADVVSGHIETVKCAIHAALKTNTSPVLSSAETQAERGAKKLVYLICDEHDAESTIPVRKALTAHDIEVRIPLFDGDAATVRSANQELLTQCDDVVLFYGAGDEAWKRSVESELRKTRALRIGKPDLSTYTALADPATPAKADMIAVGEPNVVDGRHGFPDAAIARLLAMLEGCAA